MLYRRIPVILGTLLASATLLHQPCSADSNSPITRVSQQDSKLMVMEHVLEGMVNAERAKAGLKPLEYKVNLAEVGRAHSLEMRELKYFAHESPTRTIRFPGDRYRAAYANSPAIVAENIYHAWGGPSHELTEDDIIAAHKAFMNSPTHRENILFGKFTHIGIGIVTDGNGSIWVTQMFSRG